MIPRYISTTTNTLTYLLTTIHKLRNKPDVTDYFAGNYEMQKSAAVKDINDTKSLHVACV